MPTSAARVGSGGNRVYPSSSLVERKQDLRGLELEGVALARASCSGVRLLAVSRGGGVGHARPLEVRYRPVMIFGVELPSPRSNRGKGPT
jgi:hypothetical protein